MVFSLFRGASPSKEKAKFQPLILHCSESSYRSVSDTGGRIGFSAEIKYYLNAVMWMWIRIVIKIRIRIILVNGSTSASNKSGSGSASK
jgi:hypothetical protein